MGLPDGYVATPGQSRKHSLAGAYDLERRDLLAVDGLRRNSDLFILLCEHLVEVLPGARRIHLGVGNHIVHSSKKTKAALKELGGGAVIHLLPPYRPDDCAIERVWWDVHACVTRNHTCRTIEELITNAYIRLVDWLTRTLPASSVPGHTDREFELGSRARGERRPQRDAGLGTG